MSPAIHPKMPAPLDLNGLNLANNVIARDASPPRGIPRRNIGVKQHGMHDPRVGVLNVARQAVQNSEIPSAPSEAAIDGDARFTHVRGHGSWRRERDNSRRKPLRAHSHRQPGEVQRDAAQVRVGNDVQDIQGEGAPREAGQ